MELLIDFNEIKRLGISLEDYLTLLSYQGSIEYPKRQEPTETLLKKDLLKELPNKTIVLSPKAIIYFQSDELFNEFFNTFPHTVPDRFGEGRPLRTLNINTNGALVTKGIFNRKTKGNKELQQHIINVLKAEINWRNSTGKLNFMNNIDTWLRQYNWEKYEYLLEQTDYLDKL